MEYERIRWVIEETLQRQQKRKNRCGKGEEKEESGGGHSESARVKELIERVITSEAFQIVYSVM
jgi:hypothetical protein